MLFSDTKRKVFLAVICAVLVAAGNSLNCSAQTKQAKRAFDFRQALKSDGTQRTYSVHVPASYDRTKPMPLVMVFHGLHMNGQVMSLLTRFNVLADRKNFVAVYPDGLGNRWSTNYSGGADDVRFVYDLINNLSRTVNIDSRRIYAVGMSNGGYFTERLACEMPDRLAGIAVVAASMMDATASHCGANRRVPAMFFIGSQDPLVPSEDNEHNDTLGKLGDAVGLSGLGNLSVPVAKMGGVMTEREAVDFWCRHNQCSLSPYSVNEPDKDPHDGTRVQRETFGSYNSEVVLYSIKGGGHTWPGAFYSGPADVMGKTCNDIDATELITEFFLRHSS
ncbi:MAG TPA: PHB depolymerase family esterase [Drouetiella sp.]